MERSARNSIASEEQPEARYANYFHVGHNAFEVILEFGQYYEGARQPQMHTRIVVAPVYAKEFLHLLEIALKDYVEKFGQIASEGTHE
jgi:hypothetical protein